MRTARAFIVIFIIILSSRAGQSQPWYLNEIYNPNNTWAMGLSIIATDSGYFGCGVSPLTDPGYLYASTFVLDLNGEMTQWHSFGRYGANFYAGDEGALTKCNDGFASFSAVKDLQNDSMYGIFYKFDQLGDTIFTKLFFDQSYNTVVGRTCTSTSDNGYALAGEVSIDFGFSNIILIKIDSNGNEQWRCYVGTDIDDWPKSVIQTSDGGYAIGSWTCIPWELETADPVIFKTDSLGTLEWTLNLGGPFLDDKAMLCNTSDSCIIVLTAIADSMYTPDYGYSRTELVKINLHGDTLWTKKYKTSQNINLISNIAYSQNNDYIACGTSKISVYLPRAGWLFNFNSNGDSLWYRDYYYYPEDPTYGSNYLSDVSQASDGGFVATGDASTMDPPDNENKIWVLKVDSAGCEIPNCWVGIEEEGGVEAGKQGSVEIFPNPASDLIHVRWNMDDGRFCKVLELKMYDIFGRPAPTPAILTPLPTSPLEGGGEWKIDVSSLPPGVYFISVLEEGNRIASGKFVVSR